MCFGEDHKTWQILWIQAFYLTSEPDILNFVSRIHLMVGNLRQKKEVQLYLFGTKIHHRMDNVFWSIYLKYNFLKCVDIDIIKGWKGLPFRLYQSYLNLDDFIPRSSKRFHQIRYLVSWHVLTSCIELLHRNRWLNILNYLLILLNTKQLFVLLHYAMCLHSLFAQTNQEPVFFIQCNTLYYIRKCFALWEVEFNFSEN